jgi:hypothetical protein
MHIVSYRLSYSLIFSNALCAIFLTVGSPTPRAQAMEVLVTPLDKAMSTYRSRLFPGQAALIRSKRANRLSEKQGI